MTNSATPKKYASPLKPSTESQEMKGLQRAWQARLCDRSSERKGPRRWVGHQRGGREEGAFQ